MNSLLFFNTCYLLWKNPQLFDTRLVPLFFCAITAVLLVLSLSNIVFGVMKGEEIDHLEDTILGYVLVAFLFADHTFPVLSPLFSFKYDAVLAMLLFVRLFNSVCAFKIRNSLVCPAQLLLVQLLISTFCMFTAYKCLHDRLVLHGPMFTITMALDFILSGISSIRLCLHALSTLENRRQQSTGGPIQKTQLPWLKSLDHLAFPLIRMLIVSFFRWGICQLYGGTPSSIFMTVRLALMVDDLWEAGENLRILALVEFYLPQATRADLGDQKCPICMEAIPVYNSKKLTCGHVFDKHCLFLWLSKREVCPLCRNPVI